MSDDHMDQTAVDLAAAARQGSVSAVALAEASLARIAARDAEVEAWAYLDRARVLEQAIALDAKRARGEPLGPLHGVPVGVKDIIDTADMPTEYNSPLHRGRRPAADAVIVQRLRAAGAIVMGKTVTSEFAVYTPGPTRNPHDPARTPGGSSSGSAAAVAAGMVPLALATQTNGSTVRPASFCGVVGFKPSLGILPRTGVLKQSTMLDQPGVMARSVADVALLTDVLRGSDPMDEQSFAGAFGPLLPPGFVPDRTPRFAFVRSPYWDLCDPSTRSALVAFATGLGGVAEAVELPAGFEDPAAVLVTIMNAGVAEVCRDDYRSARDRMSAILVGIIEAGQKLSAVDFIAALSARDRLRDAFRRWMEPFDAIIAPAALGIAPRREDGTGNPIMASTWSLLGAPALTLPLLTGPENMPLGVQLVGNHGADAQLLAAAAWLERRAGRH